MFGELLGALQPKFPWIAKGMEDVLDILQTFTDFENQDQSGVKNHRTHRMKTAGRKAHECIHT